MGVRGVVEAYVGSLGIGVLYGQAKQVINVGNASIEEYNGNAKPLDQIVGQTGAEVATVVALEGAGKAFGAIRNQ